MVKIPLKPKNSDASTSRPPNSNATQSSGTGHLQSSSQPQAAISTPSARPPAVVNTTPNTSSHVMAKYAGRWTRFWVSMC
ncbi:uncharacterized protein BJ212DRAFT_1329769 [Suillus subaureus]|uniref:Uncharacterized protein n=1 Tax=Suillus subaureus TaxID=48587 RepID=A0A9P7EJ50_9AGAM|nr:uncharacterized protein BJ212DRAFT_1329769 [Suillus subaureus]KAG1822677.1 hypothetical protein BJ212DRAFT_1329769 [Suillus subaureus]